MVRSAQSLYASAVALSHGCILEAAPATSLAGLVVLLVRGQVSISSHGGSAAFNRTFNDRSTKAAELRRRRLP
jgi:hypothetical protein